MLKPKHLLGLIIAAAPGLGGCGTSVPGFQEFPGDKVAEAQLVQSIVQNVTCEVRDAVNDLYAKQHANQLFLDGWGAQIAVNLSIEEKTDVNPNANWLPNVIFSLAGGIDVSSDATRTDIINTYHTIPQLRTLTACTSKERPGGPFLLASDLRLKDLLFDSVTLDNTGQADFGADTKGGPLGQNVISHEVKFVINSTGTLSPAWKLSRVVGVNPTGTFFSAQRNRTNDLTVTLGPTDEKGTAPASTAAAFALSSQIGTALGNSVTRIQP